MFSNELSFQGFPMEKLGELYTQRKEINKAYDASSGASGVASIGTLGTQGPIAPQSLDPDIRILTLDRSYFHLWRMMPKQRITNRIHTFAQQVRLGDGGGFSQENELSNFNTPSNTLRSVTAKHINVPFEVTIMAQAIGAIQPAEMQASRTAMDVALLTCAKSLVYGDSSIVPEEFDGLAKLHAIIGGASSDLYASFDEYVASGRCVDLRGAALDTDQLADAAVTIQNSFGYADTLVSTPEVISDFSKYMNEKTRFIQTGSGFSDKMGARVQTIGTAQGDITLVRDLFMKKNFKLATETKTNSNAPDAPTISAAALTGSVVSSSKYVTANTGQIVAYAVSSLSRKGESALTVFGTAVTLAAGKAVDITFAAPSGGPIVPDGYQVYCTEPLAAGSTAAPAGAKFYPLFKLSAAQLAAGYDGGAAGKARDNGRFLPNTQEAFLLAFKSDVLQLDELLPMSLFDLASISPSMRKYILYFVAPEIGKPTQVVRFINVGRYSGPTIPA